MIPVELFHIEKITVILDKPEMHSVRRQFLGIDFTDEPSKKTVYKVVYNQQASDFREEVKNGVRTVYRIDPVTGLRTISGIQLT